MVFTDPPYNVPIAGHIGGSGAIQHREFILASGEKQCFLCEGSPVLSAGAYSGRIRADFRARARDDYHRIGEGGDGPRGRPGPVRGLDVILGVKFAGLDRYRGIVRGFDLLGCRYEQPSKEFSVVLVHAAFRPGVGHERFLGCGSPVEHAAPRIDRLNETSRTGQIRRR